MKLQFKTYKIANRYFRRFYPEATSDAWTRTALIFSGRRPPLPYAILTVGDQRYFVLNPCDSWEGHEVIGIELSPIPP